MVSFLILRENYNAIQVDIQIAGNFSLLLFACLNSTHAIYVLGEISEPWGLTPGFSISAKLHRKKLFAKTESSPADGDMQSALTRACNLSLMAIATFFVCSWVVKSLCSDLSVFSMLSYVFTIILIKLHTVRIIFLNMCKMEKKIPPSWNMTPWIHRDGCFSFYCIFSTSLSIS